MQDAIRTGIQTGIPDNKGLRIKPQLHSCVLMTSYGGTGIKYHDVVFIQVLLLMLYCVVAVVVPAG
jgi:hypothetical protein